MEIVVKRIAKKKTYTIGHLYILSDKDVKRTWRSGVKIGDKRIFEHSFDKAKTGTKVTELAARFGLDSVMHKKAGKLSGGWQRRLSIAMALISEPKILFLDEPTLGLDVLARSELWDSIRELKGKVTVILTTHYMEEAEELSDRIGIMKDGCLLTVGSAEKIKESTGKDRLEDAFIAIVKGERK